MIDVRFHHLKAAANLAARAKAVMAGEEGDPTAALQRGTALHAIMFGTKRVIAYPGPVRRGKEWDAFRAANGDAEIMTGAEYEKVSRMADSLRADKEAMEYLDGIHETTVYWDMLGRRCRCTPDVRGGDFVTELKTCASAEPDRFMWQARRLHYPAQLAWQLDGCRMSGVGAPPTEARIVAVESKSPYPVTVLRLTPELLEVGRRTWQLWFEKLLGYERSNMWPNRYVQSVVEFDVPEEDFDLGSLTFANDGGDDSEEAA